MADPNGNGNGVARWGALAGVVMTAFVILAALFGLFWTSNAAFSKAEALEHRVSQLEELTTTNRTQISVLCSALIETETQFKSADQMRNLMHLDTLRTESILWKKVFATDYPIGTPYLPTIAQDNPSPCK